MKTIFESLRIFAFLRDSVIDSVCVYFYYFFERPPLCLIWPFQETGTRSKCHWSVEAFLFFLNSIIGRVSSLLYSFSLEQAHMIRGIIAIIYCEFNKQL